MLFRSLSKDFLAENNFVRAENELNNIIKMDKSNKWALLKLKEIATKNNNWKDALNFEKKLMNIDINHKKNDESMLNYYIAMDYKSKDNIKNYVYYLEKSASCEKVHPDSLLELANHNIDNVDLAIHTISCMQRINFQSEQWLIIKLKIFFLTISVLMM